MAKKKPFNEKMIRGEINPRAQAICVCAEAMRKLRGSNFFEATCASDLCVCGSYAEAPADVVYGFPSIYKRVFFTTQVGVTIVDVTVAIAANLYIVSL